MNVAIAASEVAPFAKTGGLADVIGALPKAIAALGWDVKVFLPKYNSIDESKYGLHYDSSIGELSVRVHGVPCSVHILKSTLPGSEVPVYFIDCPRFFHRASIYTSDHDEDQRFILFSKAIIETLQKMKWTPDVFHVNDWQTGLIPVLIRENYSRDQLFRSTGSLLTIHNIGYQGLFGEGSLDSAELPHDLFYHGGPLEKDGAVSFLKAGIMFSQAINTVSSTYSREILTPEFGAGLEAVLRMREGDLFGILNGIDDDIWNPATDVHLPHHYSIDETEGKRANKEYLTKKIGLPFREDLPLIGIVSRLVSHKGFDIIADSIVPLMEMNAQWVVLGSGEDKYERMFWAMHQTMPDKIWAYIGFNNELAHLIEAAADIFLMPSRYEPCGLNQMYSLRYGTVPVVRKTGGLADTVWDWNELRSSGSEEGNGFVFNDPTPFALVTSMGRAVSTFNHKESWKKIQRNGMKRDFSWKVSADQYASLYDRVAGRRGSDL